MPQIVYIDITATATETPSTLQATGAIVSIGGTTLASQSVQLITSYSDFSAIASSTSASGDVANAVTSFYNQGDGSVYIVELGAGAVLSTDLRTFIDNNPKTYYAFLLPDSAVSDDSDFVTFANNYVSLASMTYFFFNTDLANYSNYSRVKSIVAFIPSPNADASEMTAAQTFYEWINATPSGANKLAPFAFRYIYGATEWPENGNASTFAALKAANINIYGSGSQGGVSDTLLFWGYTADGRPLSYWYAVDWVQINLARDLSYAIITGSNSTSNPLTYSQNGIARLQSQATTTIARATTYGCTIGTADVSAIDFATYVADNPSDYSTGRYNGLSTTITPMRGFEQITFYLTVDFSGTAVVSDTTA